MTRPTPACGRPPGSAAAPRRQPPRADPRCCSLSMLPLALFYFAWLLQPERVGHPVLYALLIAAELFNARAGARLLVDLRGASAAGRRPTLERRAARGRRVHPRLRRAGRGRRADGRAATAHDRRATCASHLLDDGDSDEMARAGRAPRRRLPAPRRERAGAKAGNINHALDRTDAPFVVVLDCDHVPEPHFLEATLGCFADERVAFVQTPQYYANCGPRRDPGRGVEPAGAVLRPDRARQGRPRRDVLLRHERRLPPRPRSRASAASRGTR